MYKNILIPTDGSEFCGVAAAEGIQLAKTLGATVTVVHVTLKLSVFEILDVYKPEILWSSHDAEKTQNAMAHVEEGTKVLADKFLSQVEKMANDAGVPCVKVYIPCESHAERIIKVAGRHGCGLIFMASHGRTVLAGELLGSVTKKVLAYSKIPVLVRTSRK